LFFAKTNKIPIKISTFVNQINTTNKEIDELVYEFYGLSEEEIKIIEK
jgi:hypothetical protein